MKRIVLNIIGLLSLFASVNAQTLYVCDGFTFDKYEVASLGDIKFNSTGDSVSIQGNTYAVEDIDSITFNEPLFPKVTIVYNGSTATVTIPENVSGVTCSSGNSSHVVLTSNTTSTEYLYVVEGNSPDGSLTLHGEYKLTLMMNGINLTSKQGAAIDIDCGKRIDIIMNKGTVNTLEDYEGGAQKAALYTRGHAEFKGAGTLNVSGNLKHAISAKEYIIFKASLGTVNILKAASDGIHCGKGKSGDAENNYFQMNGGNVTISNCLNDCIDSDDYGCVKIKGGMLTLNISQEDGNGVKCDSIFEMKGGTIDMNITGASSNGIRMSYEGLFKGGVITGHVAADGARGIRGRTATKLTATVKGGGDLTFSGSNVNLTVSGGMNDAEKCYGICTDKILTQTAGDLSFDITNGEAEAIFAKIADNWIGGTRNGSTK